jgi:hypothetical protein
MMTPTPPTRLQVRALLLMVLAGGLAAMMILEVVR